MPELPEVTTTVEGIRKTSLHKKIVDVWGDWPRMFPNTTLTTLRKKLIGEKISHVERCGKQILMHIGDYTLLAHMKMTGHFLYGIYVKNGKHFVAHDPGPLRDDPFNKYIHFLLHFENGLSLALSDARKFAKIRFYPQTTLRTCDDVTDLGPDALALSHTTFAERIGTKPRGKIKQVLMNQAVVAGIGNIYSDEALWHAGMAPTRQVGQISKEEFRRLHKALGEVLRKGIRFNGDSDSDYRNIDGERGKFQKHHRVYRTTGKPCEKKDGGTIKRIVVGGRSAHFCPKHQK